MMNKNWSCDGVKCTDANSEVRLFPTGGSGNLIVCKACHAHEVEHRRDINSTRHKRDHLTVTKWDACTAYETA